MRGVGGANGGVLQGSALNGIRGADAPLIVVLAGEVFDVIASAPVVGTINVPAAGVVQVELQARYTVLGHVQYISDLHGLLVRAVEIRE
ncbi:hypothetical protein D3C78_887870 [compost metagenome]